MFYRIAYAMAYPFWPKEMKELIKKYEAEAILNENWFDVHASIMKVSTICIGLALLAWATSGDNIILIVILLFLLGLWNNNKLIYFNMIAPYSLGSQKKCIPTKNKFFGTNIRSVYFQEAENKKQLKGKYYGNTWKKEDFPKIGEPINLYVTEIDKYGVMPDIEYMKKAYSLIKNTT